MRRPYDSSLSGRTEEDAVSASDIVATIYDALGISPEMEIRDRLDRPMLLLPEGTPIREVFA